MPASAPLLPTPMSGGPVGGSSLPPISELQRLPDPAQHQFRPLYSSPPTTVAATHVMSRAMGPNHHQLAPGTNGSPHHQMNHQPASQPARNDEAPAKKQSKWTPDEDNLTIELRGQGMKWDDIAIRLPGRSSISCRLRYQNYLEKRASWDEEKKNKLARLYARFKPEMWQKIAGEMGIPWRAAEAMHWQLGEQDMSVRANAPVFHLHPSSTVESPTLSHAMPATHGFTPLNGTQLLPAPPPQHQQISHTHPVPAQTYHQSVDINSAQGRRKSSFYSNRRTDARLRSSVPPQHGLTGLVQIQPASGTHHVTEPRTSSPAEVLSGRGSEDGEPHRKRRREQEVEAQRSGSEALSPGLRSPGRSSRRSTTVSPKITKQESEDESMGAPDEPSPSKSP